MCTTARVGAIMAPGWAKGQRWHHHLSRCNARASSPRSLVAFNCHTISKNLSGAALSLLIVLMLCGAGHKFLTPVWGGSGAIVHSPQVSHRVAERLFLLDHQDALDERPRVYVRPPAVLDLGLPRWRRELTSTGAIVARMNSTPLTFVNSVPTFPGLGFRSAVRFLRLRLPYLEPALSASLLLPLRTGHWWERGSHSSCFSACGICLFAFLG